MRKFLILDWLKYTMEFSDEAGNGIGTISVAIPEELNDKESDFIGAIKKISEKKKEEYYAFCNRGISTYESCSKFHFEALIELILDYMRTKTRGIPKTSVL